MIEPGRHEHPKRRAGEEKRDEDQWVGALVQQPSNSQCEREEQQQERKHRRHRDRDTLRVDRADERSEQQDQASQRQVDQPRPMDVGAQRRVQPILAKIVPVLAGEQRTNLAHPHIVIGVGEHEELDRVPTIDDEVDAKAEPDGDRHPLPVAINPLDNAIQAWPFLKTFLL